MTSTVHELGWRDSVAAADVQRVAELVAATGFFNPEEQAIAVELVDERLRRGEDSGYSFLFAEREDELAGYSCFGRTPGTACSYDLYWIVVAPSCQRSGIGTRLLTEVEARIRRAGGAHVWIDTSGRAQYEPTRAFYRRSGYREAARLVDFYAPGDDKLILTKNLDQAS